MSRTPVLVFLVALSACASSRARHVTEDSEPEAREGHYRKEFDDPEKWASVFDDPERDTWQKPELVVERLGVEPGDVVADIGAGTGYFAPYLSRAVGPEGRVLAIDIEASMVEYMNERFRKQGLDNAEARLAEPADPKLSPSSVDGILIVNTWHHVPNRVAYAGRLRNALRAGGRVAIVDFTTESPMGPPKHHRISAEQVRQTLEDAGLTSRILAEDLPRQYVVVGDVAPE